MGDDDDVRKPLLGVHQVEVAIDRAESLPAIEVSKAKRIFQIAIAVIFCLFAAGPVFGYAALKPVLIAEGVYRHKCTEQEVEEDVRVCRAQDLSLNFMFTVAAVGALFVGTVLDRFGPRTAGLVGGVSIGIGTAHMAFARTLQYDAYLVGYGFLALGGPFIFISSFQLSNAFPQYSGSILSLLTGAFDASSIVFWVYRVLYERSGEKLSPKKFFAYFMVVPALILLAQATVMPKLSYKTVPELVEVAEQVEEAIEDDDEDAMVNPEEDSERAVTQRNLLRERRQSYVSEITELLGTSNTVEAIVREESKHAKSGVWGMMHGKSAWEQIRSPWWILMALFIIIQMIRINYFVATIRSQYEYLLHSFPSARRVNEFFDLALPLGGLVSVPFVGLLLDSTSTPTVLTTLVSTATLLGLLGLLPSLPAAYATVLLFVVYRPFFYTSLSDYVAKVFGFETFGVVYGSLMCLSGMLNLSQAGLDWLTKYEFGRNPTPVNVVLLMLALVLGCVLVWFVKTRADMRKEERLGARGGGAVEASYGTL